MSFQVLYYIITKKAVQEEAESKDLSSSDSKMFSTFEIAPTHFTAISGFVMMKFKTYKLQNSLLANFRGKFICGLARQKKGKGAVCS